MCPAEFVSTTDEELRRPRALTSLRARCPLWGRGFTLERMAKRAHITSAQRALTARDWGAAKAAFEAALVDEEAAEALSGLGEAVFWLGDLARAIALRERAYVAYRDRGDGASAARMALWLATQHGGGLGNHAVANGWVSRAQRLLRDVGPCAEAGWLMLRRSRAAADSASAERLASEAIHLAKVLGDPDLEIAAISQRGRALLARGRIDDGFDCLDEAMAAATAGELRSAETFGDTCCDMIGACERAMDIDRARQWCHVTMDFARRVRFEPIFAFCRVTYAGVLISQGKWTEAEGTLREALHSYDASFVAQRHFALSRLAELRLLQGRDAEAEAILAEHGEQQAAARPAAMLHLARGDGRAAVRVLRARIAAVRADVLRCAPLLALLVEAQLATGDLDKASQTTHQLDSIAKTTNRPPFSALAAFARGLVAGRNCRVAVASFETAAHTYATLGMPLQAARARLGLARSLADTDVRVARESCRTAIAAFERLGARRDQDAAAGLARQLGVGARTGPRATTTLTRREEEVLSLLGLGLPNAKIGARLFISPKTVEHHVGNILAKLGVDTRAAAAAYWATRSGKKPGGE